MARCGLPKPAALESQSSVSKIGHVVTDGTGLQEFATQTSNAEPSGITAGPDGALWFTECTTGKIGRITTTGAVTEITLPNAAASPYPLAIVTGPDNNLWFVECNTNDIARMQ